MNPRPRVVRVFFAASLTVNECYPDHNLVVLSSSTSHNSSFVIGSSGDCEKRIATVGLSFNI